MGQIVWSRRIIADIHAAAEYHRPFSPAFADKLTVEIFAKGRLPESQRIVPEASRGNIRELLHKKYRIIYQVTTAARIVLLVLHPASQPLSPTSLLQ